MSTALTILAVLGWLAAGPVVALVVIRVMEKRGRRRRAAEAWTARVAPAWLNSDPCSTAAMRLDAAAAAFRASGYEATATFAATLSRVFKQDIIGTHAAAAAALAGAVPATTDEETDRG